MSKLYKRNCNTCGKYYAKKNARFYCGHKCAPSSFKDRHHSKESKALLAQAHLEKKHTEATKLKMSLAGKGRKQTLEHIKKRIVFGEKHYNFGGKIVTPEYRDKMSDSLKKAYAEGRKKYIPVIFTIEMRKKIGESRKGEKGSNWQGGKTLQNALLRAGLNYKLWREAVFKKDNFTCKWCKQVGGKLTADHIKMWAYYPELRYEVSNGQTLCKGCHAWKSKWDFKIYRGQVPELNILKTY